jgi:hypothetical protein
MASLDFIRDIEETLKLQKIDYFIVSIQRGEKSNRIDVFNFFSDREGLLLCEETLKETLAKIKDLKKKSKGNNDDK